MSTDLAPVAPPSRDVFGIAPDALSVPDHRSSRRTTLRLFAVLLLLTVALRLPAFFVDVFNSDETFLGAQAEVISHGGKLYQEAADRKPPLVPYVYAATFAIFATTALWSVRVMAMLAVALTALFLALEARRRYGTRAAWIAGVLMVLASVAFAPQDASRPRVLVRRRRRARHPRQADGCRDAAAGALPPVATTRPAGGGRRPRRLRVAAGGRRALGRSR